MPRAQAEWAALVPGTAKEVWPLIAEAKNVSAWWGGLSDDLSHVAQNVTLNMGGVSHYRLWVEALVPGRLVAFTSAYLGVSPLTQIRIHVTDTMCGVEVRVVESYDTDSPATIKHSEAMWRQRLDRLVAHAHAVAHGAPALNAKGTPVSLSRDIHGAHMLRPLHSSLISQWLPLGGSPVPAWFFIVDSEGPRRFRLTRWHMHYDDLLTLGIEVIPGSIETLAEIWVAAAPYGAVTLSVRHSGWDNIDDSPEERDSLRERFTATWEHALDRAVSLCNS